jgi:DNA-binding NarL/FixJ family response regulator
MIAPLHNEPADYPVRRQSSMPPFRAGIRWRRGQAPRCATLIRTVVADDSPAILKALSSLLEQQDNIQLVGTATDGYHALRRVRELEPDLVLTALRLEGMNGLEVARHIKARPHAPAVIMVTAEDTRECRAAARVAGVDGFVGKWHMLTRLPAAIRELFPTPIILDAT